jgi:CBS domain-containing protein
MGRHLQTALAATDPDGFAKLLGANDDPHEALTSLAGIPADAAGAVVARLGPAAAERLLTAADDARVTTWLGKSSTDDGIRILARLPAERVDRLVNAIDDHARRRALRRLAAYPAGSVGALARTRAVIIREDVSVEDIGERIRSAGVTDDSPVLVTRHDGSLLGVLDLMRFLQVSDKGRTAADLCLPAEALHAGSPVDSLRLPDDWGRLTSLPVVDAAGRPVGFVSRSTLERSRSERGGGTGIVDAFIELARHYLDFLAWATARLLDRRTAS